MSAATMRDVAQLAGVSVKTVSNVVNRAPHVTDATAQKVQAAIAQLGYRMNFAARSLSLGRTGMITLAVPQLSLPYFAELCDDVIQAAARRGYTVLLEQTGGQHQHELGVLTSDRRRMTDGLIFSPIGLREEDAEHLAVRFPMVLLGERPLNPTLEHVAMENRAGARAVTEHLLELGRRRIAVVGTYDTGETGAGYLRTSGYLDALEAWGVEREPVLRGTATAWDLENGARAIREVLERCRAAGTTIDAVFALNDALALGAIRELLDQGLRVPGDIAVAGFDDIKEAGFASPRLTTVDPGRKEIARRAVDLLLGQILDPGGEHPSGTVSPPFTLRARESTLG
ncbi:LacI family DNA-binding transcriptional regulator [Georgenia halophila]|uniref:LacI family DNA-binding transcriptional regulator n=1 Tax=Georgenia halophila TaxID=620889 RepID=A0ABP8LGQ4_9MICO